MNHLGRVWFIKLGDHSNWTKHKFNPKIKCEVNKTNFVESFNATLGIDKCYDIVGRHMFVV